MGIPVSTFWDSSPNEIIDLMESCQRRRERERKERIWDDFVAAEVQAVNVSAFLMSDKKEPVRPWDYYPELFAKEKGSFKELEEKQKFEEYKEQRKAYIREFNSRMNSAD